MNIKSVQELDQYAQQIGMQLQNNQNENEQKQDQHNYNQYNLVINNVQSELDQQNSSQVVDKILSPCRNWQFDLESIYQYTKQNSSSSFLSITNSPIIQRPNIEQNNSSSLPPKENTLKIVYDSQQEAKQSKVKENQEGVFLQKQIQQYIKQQVQSEIQSIQEYQKQKSISRQNSNFLQQNLNNEELSPTEIKSPIMIPTKECFKRERSKSETSLIIASQDAQQFKKQKVNQQIQPKQKVKKVNKRKGVKRGPYKKKINNLPCMCALCQQGEQNKQKHEAQKRNNLKQDDKEQLVIENLKNQLDYIGQLLKNTVKQISQVAESQQVKRSKKNQNCK